MNNWLNNAVFYEIYPTSFFDASNDGIGDIKGIISKLDYVTSLGCNAIWINPFYRSPFKDGGYDVSDFFDVDPKFGTLDDFKELLKVAKQKGIRIVIDLIPGHASEQHPDFLKSAEPNPNFLSDLFIWNSCVWDLEQPYRLISGRYDRNGCYLVNFFSTQPALNYGFNKITHPKWQLSYKDPKTFIARDYLKKIITFWLDLGVDGFRVDMADSLVKNDDDKTATIEVWQDIFASIRPKFPEAVFISEWSNVQRSLKSGFDCDFVLDHWDNFYHRFSRSNNNSRGLCVLKGGDDTFFKKDLKERIEQMKAYSGTIGLISGNHDTTRIASYLDDQELKLFYLTLFTLPGVPFIYYGDEIKMKHYDIPSKDGGYQRTGDRLPMEFDKNLPNFGFSSFKGELYLPQFDELDPLKEQTNPNSIFNWIKTLAALKKEQEELKSKEFELLETPKGIIAYRRDTIYIYINVGEKDYPLPYDIDIILKTSDSNNSIKRKEAVVFRKKVA